MAAALLALLFLGWWLFQRASLWTGPGIRWLRLAPGPWWRWRWWLVRMWLCFGGSAALALIGLGGWPLVMRPPVALLPVADRARGWVDGLGGADALLVPLFAGFAIGLVIVTLLDRWRARRHKHPPAWRKAMEPGTIAELAPALAAAATAAIVEEVYFRLALPLVLAILLGNAWVAISAATGMFVWLHRYQGWRGLVLVTLTGVGLTIVYLGTGALWIAVALHFAIDVNAIVLRPLLAGRVRFSSSADSRF